jgi:hypothetical protein
LTVKTPCLRKTGASKLIRRLKYGTLQAKCPRCNIKKAQQTQCNVIRKSASRGAVRMSQWPVLNDMKQLMNMERRRNRKCSTSRQRHNRLPFADFHLHNIPSPNTFFDSFGRVSAEPNPIPCHNRLLGKSDPISAQWRVLKVKYVSRL